ncbi:ATP-dependent DNA helicase RecG [Patescibacteria group bacterium]|nr:ATP-dependent DNA helicase RecG [Patescibacteria group bacterium]
MNNLAKSLTDFKGVGPVLLKKLNKLGLNTAQDLLWHLPTRYEDFSNIKKIKDLKPNEKITIKGKIQTIKTQRLWPRRLTLTQALLNDGSGTIKAIWFNQPYLAKNLKPGEEIWLSGQLKATTYGQQLEQPHYEKSSSQKTTTANHLIPYYPLSDGLTHHTFRQLIKQILPYTPSLTDWLPTEIKNKFKLLHHSKMLTELHFPSDKISLSQARRRLVFDELYLTSLQNNLAKIKREQKEAPPMPFQPALKNFVNKLPYQLTSDQKIAAWEIIKDLEKDSPMFRLLQGDVGSGKTVVAGLAALNCFLNNYQTALLAPTEVLANQHFNTLKKMLADFDISLALLTQGQSLTNNDNKISKVNLKKLLADGKINIIIGTHTLLKPAIKIPQLGLVIVDEQHRFGVNQRQILTTKNKTLAPHFLSLTATPIPRSLSLALYGDLAISLIKKLPPGRKAIITKIITDRQKKEAYQLIEKEIALGNKVFIICPLVEESDLLNATAANQEHTRLQKEIFPNIKLGLLHGRLNSAAKQQALTNFKNGHTPILVATSVVEVGLDIPEATVMAIENAERFGLAQLHQLRGRIGRSNLDSHCLLITNNAKNERLTAMIKYPNGFDLAEFDLKTRGPGSLLGATQSGFIKLKYWELVNSEIIKIVRQAVLQTISLDATLQTWPELKLKIKQENTHLE